MTDLSLANFLGGLHERRLSFRESFKYFAPQAAPRFNVFDFVRPNEVVLSELIAFLLNPSGRHDQGGLFLKTFLDSLPQRSELGSIPQPSGDEAVQVVCESCTDRIVNRNRRIDIEISFDGFGIAIENKPWAGDGYGQLQDYASHMALKFPDKWRLIYLTGDVWSPDESSLSAARREALLGAGHYVELDYGFICVWLERCERNCLSDRVRLFIRDFKAWCREQFLGEERTMMDGKLVRDCCRQSDHNLETALAVAQQMDQLKDELLMDLLSQLTLALQSRLPGWRMDVAPDFGYAASRHRPIAFSKNSWSHLTLAWEFDNNNCRGLAYGIRRREEKALPHLPPLATLNKALGRAGQQSARWPWWTWGEPRDWSIHAAPWVAVRNGQMAKEIIDKLVELAGVFGPLIDAAESGELRVE